MADVENTLVWRNETIEKLTWIDINVTVKDNKTGQPKKILSGVYGGIRGGSLMALMGASGSGKTTLLNVLAQRAASAKAQVEGEILVNDFKANTSLMRQVSTYVEQEDALIGSMTVRETIYFAARLSLPSSVSRLECYARTDQLIIAFGLTIQSHTKIGTALQKGVSGGQKRRVSIASQLVSCPKVVFLDEPTTGLDSFASYQVMSFVRDFAHDNNVLVIASIHQPSTMAYGCFDKLLLLARGKTAYFGDTEHLQDYLESICVNMPRFMNPAEFCMEWTNFDFSLDDEETVNSGLAKIHNAWIGSPEAEAVKNGICEKVSSQIEPSINSEQQRGVMTKSLVLLQRSFLKSYRDIIVYGIRMVMYLGLAIMMGTVWLRLGVDQENIQPFINAIVCLHESLNVLTPVLWFSFYEFYGGRICSSVS